MLYEQTTQVVFMINNGHNTIIMRDVLNLV